MHALRTLPLAGLLAAAALAPGCRHSAASHGHGSAPDLHVGFERTEPGAAPAGFLFGRTGPGAPGSWVVRHDPDAPGAPNILLQEDADPTDARYPLAVLDAPVAKDVAVTARCIPLTGDVDRAAGLVVRWRDAKNYYVARANALENNVRFYVVEDGVRRQLASADVEVVSNDWHVIGLSAVGDRFRVTWDGRPVLEQRDATLSAPGRVGLWTKADSRTGFDDLHVRVLDAKPVTR